MPSGRKRKSTAAHDSKKKPRPATVSNWEPVHVAEYLRACDPGIDAVADAIDHEGITGRVATQLTEKDLESMTTSIGERKSVYCALQDLQHPLMPAFIQIDTDQSNTISASELAHVLTRVRKRCVTTAESSALIRAADIDDSGEVDFQEFKHILKTENNDWAAAAEGVGAPRALLNGAVALRDQSDEILSRTHSAIRSGSGFVRGNDKLKGMMMPSVAMQIVVIDLLAVFPAAIFVVITLGLAFIFSLAVLWPRGQDLTHWMFGTQYRNFETGKPVGFSGMFLQCIAFYAINSVLITVMPLVGNSVFWLLEVISACNDQHGRKFTDKMLNQVLVYRPSAQDASGRHLYND